MTPAEWKKSLRNEKKALRRSISADERYQADRKICETILSLPQVESFSSLVSFVSDGSEPDLTSVMQRFLKKDRLLCLPRFITPEQYGIVIADNLHLTAEKWGIPEPGPEAREASPEILRNALWLVPGVAFDEHGGRLGRGKGIYDRLLASSGAGFTIGVFYECQKCGFLPLEEHDRPLDMIVTEKAVYGPFSEK